MSYINIKTHLDQDKESNYKEKLWEKLKKQQICGANLSESHINTVDFLLTSNWNKKEGS